jgi:hypothetical protein
LVDPRSFPPAIRRDYVSQTLVKGVVIRKYVDNITAPKPKMFVLAGLDFESARAIVIFINSEMTDFALKHPEVNARHIEITPREYDFLHHRSYINCSQAHSLELNRLINDYFEDISQRLGDLTPEHLALVAREVNSAKTVSPKDRSIINRNWTPEAVAMHIKP